MLLILDLFMCCIFVHSGQVRNMATLKDSKSLCTLFGFSMEHLIMHLLQHLECQMFCFA